jgi:hypothetical protein
MMRIVDHPQSLCVVGVARGDVTPPVGIYHRTWGAAPQDRATGVHRPLTATVLLLEPQRNPLEGLTLIALDHCLLFEEEQSRLLDTVARRTGVDPDWLLVAFSHTHAAGLMDGNRADRPGGELIAPYLDQLATRLSELILEARSRLQPATLSYGQGNCDLAANRDFVDECAGRSVIGYNPDGEADQTVLVIRLTGQSGDLIATVVNYACHPTTLGWANSLISPDYPGAMRDVVERVTGAPCLFLQGASGDLGPREGFVGDPAIADRNGRQLAYAALSALEGLPPHRTRYEYAGIVESGTAIGTWRHTPIDAAREEVLTTWRRTRRTVDLPYKRDRPTLETARGERERWQREWQTALDRGDAPRAAECRALVERADRLLVRISGLPPGPTYPFILRIWQAGDAFWLAVESEHYQHLQVELRRRFPSTPIVVVTLVNGSRPVYLPTTSAYSRPVYQVEVALLAAGCLERVVELAAGQIEQWRRSPLPRV